MEDDEFSQLLAEAPSAGEAVLQTEAQARVAGKGVPERAFDAVKAAGVGVWQSIFETKDMVFGEPAEHEKMRWRQNIERMGADLRRESPVNAVSTSVTQFVTGLLAAKKITGAVGIAGKVEKLPRAARIAYESLLAAGVGATVFDPHEERLSDLIQSVPELRNPVTEYLASDPTDSAAEGRFKTAIESIGMDAALVGPLVLATRAYRALRGGNKEAAAVALDEVEKTVASKGDEVVTPQAAETEVPVVSDAAPAEPPRPVTVGELLASPQAGPTVDDVVAGGGAMAPDPVLDPIIARAEALGSPLDLAVRYGEDPEGVWRELDSLRQDIKAAQRGLVKKYGAKNVDALDGMEGVSEREYDFLFTNKAPLSGAELEKYSDVLQPVDTLDDAAREISYELGRLPEGLDPKAFSEEQVLALARLQVLFGEVKRLGGDLPETIRAAGVAYGSRFADPNDAIDMATEAAGKLRSLLNDTPTPSGGQAALPPSPEADIAVVPNQRAGLEEVGAEVRPAAPKVEPFPDEEVAGLVESIGRDAETILKYGSRLAAVEAGQKFGGVTSIPWQKIDSPETLKAFIDRASTAVKGQLDAAKGGEVLSDKRLQRIVNQRVRLYGENPEQIVGMFQRAGKEATSLAANMEAADAVAVSMAADAYVVARKLNTGDLAEWGGDAVAAKAELVKRAGLAMSVFGASRSMLSNSARTLRRARGDLPRLTYAEIEKIKHLDADALARLLGETGGDIGALKEVLNKPSLVARAVDAGSWLLVNNLLWGWKTHVVNFAGNAYMLASRPAEKYIGSFAVEGGAGIRAQAAREYRFLTSTLADSFYAAGQAFMRGDSLIAPFQTEVHQFNRQAGSAVITWTSVKNTGDLAANALRAAYYTAGLPTRFLGAADEAIKQIRYRSYVMAAASVKADEMGLTGKAWRDFIDRELTGAFDEAGQALNDTALREAKVTTFTQELDPKGWGSTVQNVVVKHPSAKFVVPFVRTPTNVLRYGVKLTPGLNLLQREYRESIKGLRGAEQQAHAVGQLALGTLFLGTAAALVAEGRFTGSGPTDPKLRQQLVATGWQPNSLVIPNEDGTRTYIPMSRFDPVGLPMGMIADIMDIMQHPDKLAEGEAGIMAIAIAMARQLENRTYLMNVTEFLKAVTDPGQAGQRFAGRLAGNMVPGASMLRQVNPDPYMRDARGFVDNVMATVPGLSDKLAPRYNPLGEPVTVRKSLSSTGGRDVVDDELERMGVEADRGLLPPTPYVTRGVDLRDVTLEDGRNAYAVYQEYIGQPKGAPSLREALSHLIKSPGYQKLVDGEPGTKGTRLHAIMGIVERYREAGRKRLQAESPIYRDAVTTGERRVRAALTAGPKDSRAEGGLAAIRTLLQQYGLGDQQQPQQ